MRGFGRLMSLALGAGLLVTGTISVGCQSSHEEGVKSNLHSQWTDVNADTQVTTDAAKAVLQDQGLRDVKGSATNVDGKASGKMANDKKVEVAIKKNTRSSSQVSVTVGTVGDPKLGAEIAKKIKMRAESGAAGTGGGSSVTQ